MSASVLPSPKLCSPSALSHQRWYRFYAMFSDDFAAQVVEKAKLPASSLILDPWLGVGTTTSAAINAGHRAAGIDVNPAMVVVARGRLANRTSIASEVERVAKHVTKHGRLLLDSEDPLYAWFEPEPASAFRRWERAIRGRRTIEQLTDLDCFMLTAIFDAAVRLGSRFRTKNPTWLRSPEVTERIQATPEEISLLISQVAQERITLCKDRPNAAAADLQVGTAANLPVPSESIDFVLTSPPYCTRIDYAIGTRLELAVLGIGSLSLRKLRDITTGTSTIRKESILEQASWGSECLTFLSSVSEHFSKASKSYYYKTYLQYFSDLFLSIGEIGRCLKSGGQAVIVVQDSYYKGIHTNLAKIVTEFGAFHHWDLLESHDYEASRNIRRVNTKSRKYREDTNALETVLWFSKKG